MASTILSDNGVSSGSAGIKSTADSTGALALQTTTAGGAATTAMTIDTSQNVGIGTTSPEANAKMTVFGNGIAISTNSASVSASGYDLKIRSSTSLIGIHTDSNSGVPTLEFGNGGSGYCTIKGTAAVPMTFQTNSTERMRIDSSGTVMVNSSSQVDFSKFQVVGATASNNLVVLQDTGTTYGTSQFYQKFLNSSAAVAGSIQHTAVTTVAYSTTSDGRLKEDKGIATDMSVIDNTVIHDFVWKLDGLVDRGIFAQEAHLVKPTAISVGNDELTEDGNLRNPWGVDYSKYVPELIVYCQQLKKITQEQQALITALTARIETLENKT